MAKRRGPQLVRNWTGEQNFKPFRRNPLKNPNFIEKQEILKKETIENNKINILVNL